MIIDTHVHPIAGDQQKYPRRPVPPDWVTDTSAETLLSLNRDAGIDKTVLVQGFGPYAYDNSYATDCARSQPDSFVCVVIVDQRQPDAPERLAYWVTERGARGLRLVTNTEPETQLDDPLTFPVWQRAASLRIPVCILTRFHQVSRLQAVLERFPAVSVALDHLGGPRLSDGPPYQGLQPLFELARFANLYLKFSSETFYAAQRGRSNAKEFFSRVLDRFGAHRLMWGSNFPATHDRPLKQQLALAREELSFVPAEEQRWLFGETALSLWPELR
jgi:predicted TIM-barrel fold metal-dependent hydrolase